MANRVVICGVDTSMLPKTNNKETIALIKEAKSKKEGSRELCIFGNMRLVLSIVQRFSISTDNVDDIFQVGMIGLMKAIDNFDVNLGVQFSTYAVPMIIGEIKRFQRDRSSIKITRSMRDLAYQAFQAKQFLSKSLSNEPTIDDISKYLNVPASAISDALDATLEPVSLFDTIFSNGEDTISLIEQIKDTHSTEENWIENTLINDSIKKLGEREKQIVFLRYYLGKTQTEVSTEIGISQAQVSRLEKDALHAIKAML